MRTPNILSMFLNREELRALIEEENLVSDYPHLETQLQPNGFDLTAAAIHTFDGAGKLDFSNDEREIPNTTPLEPAKQEPDDEYGWWELEPGVYKVACNETLDIPDDLIGIGFPRSSLLRMGALIQNAYWDGGFTGTGAFLLRVDNPHGIHIKENARVNQLAFAHMDETADGYNGAYHEG